MILGIDVGGTHTDAVLISREDILSTVKVPTRHDDLLASILDALDGVLENQPQLSLEQFNLSTTLCTNAIVQDELASVGVLVSAGPGINPLEYKVGGHYLVVRGGLDHRGTEITPLDLDQAMAGVQEMLDAGLEVFAVVSKFSPRNPSHEQKLASLLEGKCAFLTQGHLLSGQLNFPRRIATAYYNSAVWPIFKQFVSAVEQSLAKKDLQPSSSVLKADGGTMPFEQARKFPVESIFSGPAASIMGIRFLCDITEDALLFDIGGTTTDIAVFANGDPLLEAEQVRLDHWPTLVRAMKTRSIGLGGDSAVQVKGNGKLQIGPRRLGPCLAQGGSCPTLADALNCTREICYGNIEASELGMTDLGRALGCECSEVSIKVIQEFCQSLLAEAKAMLSEINARPVYTIHELLENKQVVPKRIYVTGGPAKALASHLERVFGLPVEVPEHFAVANALGAAVSRPTMQVELYADTQKQTLAIPVLGIFSKINGQYSLQRGREDVMAELSKYVAQMWGWTKEETEIEIVEQSAMNMIRNEYLVGQDIRVKAQIKPGFLPGLKNRLA